MYCIREYIYNIYVVFRVNNMPLYIYCMTHKRKSRFSKRRFRGGEDVPVVAAPGIPGTTPPKDEDKSWWGKTKENSKYVAEKTVDITADTLQSTTFLGILYNSMFGSAKKPEVKNGTVPPAGDANPEPVQPEQPKLGGRRRKRKTRKSSKSK